MKRLFIPILSLLLLVGCGSSSFRWDDAVTKLTDDGYTISVHDDTEEELVQANRVFKSEITSYNYDFDFNITEHVVFSNDQKGYSVDASFTRYENSTQAKSCYDYFINTRSNSSEWKYQLADSVVISTNDDNVISLLKLSVK